MKKPAMKKPAMNNVVSRSFPATAATVVSMLALMSILALVTVAVPASAAGNPVVAGDALLADDGTVYRILGGPYSELFPEGTEGFGAAPVLALDVVSADGDTHRWLVPGTGDDDLDGLPVAVYQAATNGLYLFWQSRIGTDAHLQLIGFDGDGFGDRIAILSEGQTPRAGSAGLTVTSDRVPSSSVQGATVQRSVVHLVWWAETSELGEGAYYAPVVLEDGAYLGWHPVLPLNTLQPAGPPAESAGSGATNVLPSNPVVQPGRDRWSVVLAFTDAERRELVTAEARLLPGELVTLAREAAAFVDETDPGVGGVESLAEGIGSHLIEIGFWAHPSLRGYFATSARDRLLDLAYDWNAPAIPQDALGEKIGSHLIEIGSRYFGRDGFIDFDGTEPVHLLTLRPDGPGVAGSLEEEDLGLLEDTSALHLIRLYVVSRLSLPDAESGDGAKVFVGGSGEQSLISWEEGDTIHYRESRGAGWTPSLSLSLTPGLDREQAYRLLSERVRER